jgi:hypothetical protein
MCSSAVSTTQHYSVILQCSSRGANHSGLLGGGGASEREGGRERARERGGGIDRERARERETRASPRERLPALLPLYCRFTAALLPIFTTEIPRAVLLYCCFYCCIYCCLFLLEIPRAMAPTTKASKLYCCCFTAALLLLYCCFTARDTAGDGAYDEGF